MMIFRPFAMAMIAPFGSPADAVKAIEPPKYKGGPLTEKPDYTAMLTEARRRFPDAEFRLPSLPRNAGEPISLRMRQQPEWLPHGPYTLVFTAATDRVPRARHPLSSAHGPP